LYFSPVLRRHSMLPALAALILSGCDEGPLPLSITVVPPLTARVGQEVSVPLAVLTSAPLVSWDWRSLSNPDLSTRLRRPNLTVYTHGRAVWRWTPVAEDAGPQQIEFSAATDKEWGNVTLPLHIDTGNDPPVFREPVGEGTTLNLRSEMCVHVDVVVDSTTAPRVDLSLLEPPEGAILLPTGDLTGELSFCPTPAQIAADTVYPLTIHAAVDAWLIAKTYVIVLRRP
jgi:hypothetical protein